MFRSDDEDDAHVLDLKETYLFTNCSRHADTLGLILGVSLAALSKVLVQRRLPAANPYLVGFAAGLPAFLASYVTASSFYFSNVCWGYLKFLPEDSVLNVKLCEAERRYDTWCVPYNRTRALQDVMFWDKQVKMDRNWDLTEAEFLPREEKHEIQEQLRWVPSERYRLMHRIRKHVEADEGWSGVRSTMDKVGKGMFANNDPLMKDERLKNAAKPLPKAT